MEFIKPIKLLSLPIIGNLGTQTGLAGAHGVRGGSVGFQSSGIPQEYCTCSSGAK